MFMEYNTNENSFYLKHNFPTKHSIENANIFNSAALCPLSQQGNVGITGEPEMKAICLMYCLFNKWKTGLYLFKKHLRDVCGACVFATDEENHQIKTLVWSLRRRHLVA